MATDHRKHNIPGREVAVLRLFRAGLTERQIAWVLGVSKTTVHYYLEKARRKQAGT